MRSRYTGVLVAIALGFSACGGGENDEIRSTVSGYLDAVAKRDGRRACSYLTENAQLGVFEFKLVHVAPDHPAEACAATVARQAAKRRANRLRDAEVDEIMVDGDHATAKVDGHEIKLENVDGAWKIAVFGLASDISRDSLS